MIIIQFEAVVQLKIIVLTKPVLFSAWIYGLLLDVRSAKLPGTFTSLDAGARAETNWTLSAS